MREIGTNYTAVSQTTPNLHFLWFVWLLSNSMRIFRSSHARVVWVDIPWQLKTHFASIPCYVSDVGDSGSKYLKPLAVSNYVVHVRSLELLNNRNALLFDAKNRTCQSFVTGDMKLTERIQEPLLHIPRRVNAHCKLTFSILNLQVSFKLQVPNSLLDNAFDGAAIRTRFLRAAVTFYNRSSSPVQESKTIDHRR
jgi:hypothetical protein